MAESVVIFLVEKFSTLAKQEVELLTDAHDEIRIIKGEFKSIRAFLRDADTKSDSNQGVKEWVEQVHDLAYEIEDVLDDFFLNHHAELARQHDCFGCIKDIFKGIADFFKFFKAEHEIAAQIKDIKERIQEISDRRQRYNLSNSDEQGSDFSTNGSATNRDPREDALFLEETQLVGISGPREKLISYLLETEKGLSVVSLCGMGGLGKTTLAKMVYDSPKVKYHFPYRAWITVSQTFNAKSLLKDLCKQLLGEYDWQESMEIRQLKQKLHTELRENRYVVILDDIWTLDAWKALKHALPNDNMSGSRIVVTTRFENIAAHTCREGHGHLYSVQPLNLEDSWKLFYKKALNSSNERKSFVPEQLSRDPCSSNEKKSFVPEQLSRDPCSKFLHKCKGLPLGIVAIAGLLSTKKPSEWDQVYRSFGALMDGSVGSHLDDLRLVISFSYDDLPYHLKSCLLYMSIFPEDYSINCSTLLRLWVAEGFVVVKQGARMNLTMEELARYYLDELIQRSLVQAEVADGRKRVKTCRIHDLLREFIIGKASNQNFVTFISENQEEDRLMYTLDNSSQPQPRRLSISCLQHDGVGTKILCEGNKSFFQLRSLILFRSSYRSSIFNPYVKTPFSRFRLLKVLSLGYAELQVFPSQIVDLFYLRYLSLRGNDHIRQIPNFIAKLVNLETLDLKCTSLFELPTAILQLRQLRNLFLGKTLHFMWGVKLPVEIHKLVALEKLGVVDVDRTDGEGGNGLLVNKLGNLTQLRRLSVCNLRDDDEMQLFASIKMLNFLHTFKVSSKCGEFVHANSLSSLPPSLRSVSMDGALNQLPSWVSSLLNLEQLVLARSKLQDDPIERLQVLSNLVILKLCDDSFDGVRLCFSKGGFSSLNKLVLSRLENLNEVEVEEGGMPVIRSITFDHCVKLEDVPTGIEHLITLQKILHNYMPYKFVDGLNKHSWKTGHFPRIQGD